MEIQFKRMEWIVRLFKKLDRASRRWVIDRLTAEYNKPITVKRSVGRPRKKE